MFRNAFSVQQTVIALADKLINAFVLINLLVNLLLVGVSVWNTTKKIWSSVQFMNSTLLKGAM